MNRNRMETSGKTARGCWNELKAASNGLNGALDNLASACHAQSQACSALEELCKLTKRQWIDLTTVLDSVVKYAEPENNELV